MTSTYTLINSSFRPKVNLEDRLCQFSPRDEYMPRSAYFLEKRVSLYFLSLFVEQIILSSILMPVECSFLFTDRRREYRFSCLVNKNRGRITVQNNPIEEDDSLSYQVGVSKTFTYLAKVLGFSHSALTVCKELYDDLWFSPTMSGFGRR